MENSNIDLDIFIFIILFMFVALSSGCKSNGSIPPFPTKYIYEFNKGERVCIQYEIINNDPLTVDEGHILLENECPQGIMGFEYTDAANVFSWVRKVQKEAKKKCQ